MACVYIYVCLCGRWCVCERARTSRWRVSVWSVVCVSARASVGGVCVWRCGGVVWCGACVRCVGGVVWCGVCMYVWWWCVCVCVCVCVCMWWGLNLLPLPPGGNLYRASARIPNSNSNPNPNRFPDSNPDPNPDPDPDPNPQEDSTVPRPAICLR